MKNSYDNVIDTAELDYDTFEEGMGIIHKKNGYGTFDCRKDRILTMEGKSRGTWNNMSFHDLSHCSKT